MSKEHEMPASRAGKRRIYITRSVVDPGWGMSSLTREVAP